MQLEMEMNGGRVYCRLRFLQGTPTAVGAARSTMASP